VKYVLNCFQLAQVFPTAIRAFFERQCEKITYNPFTIMLRDIPPGSYAAAIFHDVYGDHKLHRNSLGMPTVGYGFSNNPVVRNGPPKYGDCVFIVAGPHTSIKIKMNYSTGN
jgi:uncharacterized protein (DUF2141 family)